jgi:hypothetical protein
VGEKGGLKMRLRSERAPYGQGLTGAAEDGGSNTTPLRFQGGPRIKLALADMP